MVRLRSGGGKKIHFDINTAHPDGDVGLREHTEGFLFSILPWRGAGIETRPCRESPPCQRRTGRPTGRREATCGAVSCP